MKTLNKNIILTAVAACGFVTFAANAHAEAPVAGAPSVVVRYADLNLDSESGAKALYGRLRNAAARVCGDFDPRDLAKAEISKACIENAMVSSVRTVNSLQLTRIAAAHGYALAANVNLAAAR